MRRRHRLSDAAREYRSAMWTLAAIAALGFVLGVSRRAGHLPRLVGLVGLSLGLASTCVACFFGLARPPPGTRRPGTRAAPQHDRPAGRTTGQPATTRPSSPALPAGWARRGSRPTHPAGPTRAPGIPGIELIRRMCYQLVVASVLTLSEVRSMLPSGVHADAIGPGVQAPWRALLTGAQTAVVLRAGHCACGLLEHRFRAAHTDEAHLRERYRRLGATRTSSRAGDRAPSSKRGACPARASRMRWHASPRSMHATPVPSAWLLGFSLHDEPPALPGTAPVREPPRRICRRPRWMAGRGPGDAGDAVSVAGHEEGTLRTADGLDLYWQHWPATGSNAVLINVHGLGDHSGLYPFAAWFTSGVAARVYALDTQGKWPLAGEARSCRLAGATTGMISTASSAWCARAKVVRRCCSVTVSAGSWCSTMRSRTRNRFAASPPRPRPRAAHARRHRCSAAAKRPVDPVAVLHARDRARPRRPGA